MDILAGATSVTLDILVYNSSTGAPLTGLVYNTASLTAYYTLPGAASVSITLVTQTVTGAWTSGGFVEVDSTNMPGVYRLDVPNAAFASGRSSIIYLQGATNMVPTVIGVNLVAYNNQDGVHLGLTCLPNTAVTTNASLLTSGTSTDQLSVSSGKILLQATQTGVTIPTVTTVTNQLTAAAIATGVWTDTTAGDFTTGSSIGKSIMNGVALGTGLTVNTVTNQLTAAAIATAVWQDTTSGDFTVSSSIGKSLFTSGVAPGGSGGILISGSNSGTTTFGALTITGATTMTGNVSMAAGLNITQSSSNTSALVVTGNGTGSGAVFTSGSGATGDGVQMTSGATNGNGLNLLGKGTGAGYLTTAGATGNGEKIVGGSTSGNAVLLSTAGTGTVVIPANATQINGVATTSVTTVNANIGTVQALQYDGNNLPKVDVVDIAGTASPAAGGYVAADWSNLHNATATVSLTGTTVGTTTNVTNAVTVGTINSSASNIKKNTGLNNFAFVMTDSTNHNPMTGLSTGITCQVSIDGAAFASTTNGATELGSGVYLINLAAADLNGTVITLMFTDTGADPRIITLITQP